MSILLGLKMPPKQPRRRFNPGGFSGFGKLPAPLRFWGVQIRKDDEKQPAASPGETETGRIALSDALGDADKDDAGYVRGGPKVRHAHPKGKKLGKPTKQGIGGEGVYGSSPDEFSGPNRPLNNVPYAPMGKREQVRDQFTLICEVMANGYAVQHGISKSEAYSELLRDHPVFREGWQTAVRLARTE